MNYHEFITVSLGFGTQEEFGSHHTSRREGARAVVGEPVPTFIPNGHREGRSQGAPQHPVGLHPHSSWQWSVSHRSGEGARAVGITIRWCEVG